LPHRQRFITGKHWRRFKLKSVNTLRAVNADLIKPN
jgi:hypothetical protein